MDRPTIKNKHYDKAVKALENAYRDACLWADTVRQGAEQRMGLGPTDTGVWDDPEYSAALTTCSVIWNGLLALKGEAA